MTWPRWTFTVTRLSPSSAAICLLTRPATTSFMTSRSRSVSVAVAHLQLGEARRVAAPCAVALDGRVDGVEQHLLVERLGEELDRAGLHRAHGHRNVAVPGDEDDRQSDACFRELLLKGESAHARQPHVEHEAARCVRPLRRA